MCLCLHTYFVSSSSENRTENMVRTCENRPWIVIWSCPHHQGARTGKSNCLNRSSPSWEYSFENQSRSRLYLLLHTDKEVVDVLKRKTSRGQRFLCDLLLYGNRLCSKRIEGAGHRHRDLQVQWQHEQVIACVWIVDFTFFYSLFCFFVTHAIVQYVLSTQSWGAIWEIEIYKLYFVSCITCSLS